MSCPPNKKLREFFEGGKLHPFGLLKVYRKNAIFRTFEFRYHRALFTRIHASRKHKYKSNIQNKNKNILINIVQLKIRHTFVKVLTKDVTEEALGKFPHEFHTPFQ